jgi:Ser/Thr protein kinase RdoA (MazF antagonist)
MKMKTNVFGEALQRYQGDPRTVLPLVGNESCVYEFWADHKPYILKLTHSSHRSAEQLEGEVDWLRFATSQGLRVSMAIPSDRGRYVEKLQTSPDAYYCAVAYEKAPGVSVEEKDLTPELIVTWGRTMGRLHAAAKRYQPPSPTYKRPEWRENKYMMIEKWLPNSETGVQERFYEVCERLHGLRKGQDHYGLIHSDLHHRNFLVDQGDITVIDFDDMEYHWFVNDIAKTLYNETFTFSVKPEERNAFAKYFLGHFTKGYRQELPLEPDWEQPLQDFMELRHIQVYIRLFERYSKNLLDAKGKNALAEHKRSIENKVRLLVSP